MKQQTCITIDVSQGKSHIQGFITLDQPLRKAKVMSHTTEGYKQIISLKEEIEEKTNSSPLVVFEYTGIYHKSLERFLIKTKLVIISFPHLERLSLGIVKLEFRKLMNVIA